MRNYDVLVAHLVNTIIVAYAGCFKPNLFDLESYGEKYHVVHDNGAYMLMEYFNGESVLTRPNADQFIKDAVVYLAHLEQFPDVKISDVSAVEFSLGLYLGRGVKYHEPEGEHDYPAIQTNCKGEDKELLTAAGFIQYDDDTWEVIL